MICQSRLYFEWVLPYVQVGVVYRTALVKGVLSLAAILLFLAGAKKERKGEIESKYTIVLQQSMSKNL